MNKNMNNAILLDVDSMISAYPMKDDKLTTYTVCYNLLRFVYDKGLIKQYPFDDNGDLKEGVIIKESDLTEKGKAIFWDLSEKWLVYTDNEDGKIDRKNNVKMLEKYFNKLNGNM
ncbi:hypothetical protein [Treponema pedis]|uniref:hypothetical protein n=1 Tax=Treponema pedis TaxID=409322 RepID=UPI00042022BC|nr:hypothetical protein [Treponema pedis]